MIKQFLNKNMEKTFIRKPESEVDTKEVEILINEAAGDVNRFRTLYRDRFNFLPILKPPSEKDRNGEYLKI